MPRKVWRIHSFWSILYLIYLLYQNKKKKKKKQTEDSDTLKGENIHNNTTPSQNKSGKKAKGKEKPRVEGDDLDRALAELSEK